MDARSSAPRRGTEAQVRTIKPTGGLAGWIVVSILGLAAPDAWAQTNQPPGPTPNPGPAGAPGALPGVAGLPAGNPRVGIVAPPNTPPSILAAEIRPIDLLTALRLANVQNPEINIARHAHHGGRRAAATRRGLFPPLDQPRHELRLAHRQPAAVQRQYPVREPVGGLCGGGFQRRGRGDGLIPGVYYRWQCRLRHLRVPGQSRQVVRQREFQTVAVRNQMLLAVATCLQRAAPRRGPAGARRSRLAMRRG